MDLLSTTFIIQIMQQFSIQGEEVSHSPRTQEKQPEPILEKIENESHQEKRTENTEPRFNNAQDQEGEAGGCKRFLSLAFYQQYFQVSQEQVVERIKLNFIPFKKEFIQRIKQNPDFYGPFWILTTIIFLLGSTGNLSRYFYNWEKTQYIFKLELVRYGIILIYSLGFGVPGLLYLVLRLLKCDTLKLPDLICIYGYSFGCFILVFLLCIIPWGWLHWILMVYGMINSIAFLVLNMMQYLQTLEKRSYIIFGIIGASQIFLFLMFKMVFFNLIYDNDPDA